MTPEAPREQTLMEHLLELRGRVIRAALAFLLCTIVLVPFSRELFTLLAGPLLAQLPAGTSLIATGVTAPFMAPLKLALLLAVFMAAPYVLYQLWAFVAPGLYRNEQALALPLLVSSVVLFYAGAAFAYFLVFPMAFRFFTSAAPEGVAVMTDVNSYLDFALKMFVGFGVGFEVPVATVLLVLAGIVTRAQLAAARPYVIVMAFIVGMVLTPPDVVSQIMLAVPMCLLFECGLLALRVLERRGAKAPPALNVDGPPPPG